MPGGQVHAHDAVSRDGKAFFLGNGALQGMLDAQRDIGALQRFVCLDERVADGALHTGRFVDELHHLAHQHIAFAVQKVEAQFCQRQVFFAGDQIALCGEDLFGHGLTSISMNLSGPHGRPAQCLR